MRTSPTSWPSKHRKRRLVDPSIFQEQLHATPKSAAFGLSRFILVQSARHALEVNETSACQKQAGPTSMRPSLKMGVRQPFLASRAGVAQPP